MAKDGLTLRIQTPRRNAKCQIETSLTENPPCEGNSVRKRTGRSKPRPSPRRAAGNARSRGTDSPSSSLQSGRNAAPPSPSGCRRPSARRFSNRPVRFDRIALYFWFSRPSRRAISASREPRSANGSSSLWIAFSGGVSPAEECFEHRRGSRRGGLIGFRLGPDVGLSRRRRNWRRRENRSFAWLGAGARASGFVTCASGLPPCDPECDVRLRLQHVHRRRLRRREMSFYRRRLTDVRLRRRRVFV